MSNHQEKNDVLSVDSPPNYNHQCYICDKTFSANSNLNRHLRKIHKENVQSPYNNVKCALCDSVFSSSSLYNQHLDNSHGVKIETEHHTFSNKESFEEWKHGIEYHTTSQFIKSRGEKKSKNVNKTYYSCNRSGYYVSKARTQKALKKQGSRKINGRCPASMNVTLNPDSTYDVRFVKTHVGHDFEVRHLDISDKDRNFIVEKLVSGLTKKEIIKQIRSNLEGPELSISSSHGNINAISNLSTIDNSGNNDPSMTRELLITNHNTIAATKPSASTTPFSRSSSSNSCSIGNSSSQLSSRLHLATTKDIHNIINSKHLDSKLIRHNYDLNRIDAWVQETKEYDEISSVLLYKPQNELNERFPGLREDDFIFTIMKPGQSVILKRLGYRCILIDSTYHVQCEYLHVTSISVIDDKGSGIPVAWLFATRTDLEILEMFFTLIRDRVGVISTRMLVADELDAFYQAWTNTMTRPTHNLLTPWSVLDSWTKRLDVLSNRDRLRKLKKSLRYIITESKKDKFDASIHNILRENGQNQELSSFIEYFEEKFVRNPDLWSNVFRETQGVSNTQLWRLHDKFKGVYKDGKNSKKLCRYVLSLMNLFENEQLELLMEIEDKDPLKAKAISDRHQKSVDTVSLVYEVAVQPTYWLFPSDNASDLYYEVKRENKKEKCCDLSCESCKACRHDFKCSCLDYLINWNMCKHIHKVCLMSQK